MKRLILFTICYSLFASYGQGSVSALSFSGDGYISLPSTIAFDNRDFTVSMWAKIDPVQPIYFTNLWGSGYTQIGSGYTRDIEFYLETSGTPARTTPGIHVRDGRSALGVATSFQVNDGAWHHLVFMRTGSVFSIHIDGILAGASSGALGDLDDTGAPVRLGSLFFSMQDRRMRGVLDEVSIWNRALTEDEIRHKMTERLAGTEPGLVAYYRLDEGADNTCPGGQDVCDASGNNNHGVKF